MVVAEIVEPGGHGHRAGHRGERHEPRIPEDGGEPGVHRHRHGNPAAEGAAVDERHDGGQHEQFRQAAEEDAAAGDQAELRHAHKARECGGEEGHGRRDRAGEDAGPDRRARLEERRLAVDAAAPRLEIAADVVGAVVDAHADHRHGEGDAEDIEVADARRRPGEGPCHADHEHTVGHQRVAHPTESGDDHERHGCEREPTRPHHRLLAGPHLVVFHHRQAREPDRDVGMPIAHGLDHAAQFIGGGRRAGESARRLRQPKEHEPEPPILGKQVFAREVAQCGERVGHAGPRRHILARLPRPRHRLEAGDEALRVALEGGRGILAILLPARRRSGHHLAGEPSHHRRDPELRPTAVEDRLAALDEAVDLGEIGRREVVQPLGPDLREVDLVEHRAK